MRALFAAVLVSILGPVAFVSLTQGLEPDIRITQLDCDTNPERVTIENLGDAAQDLSGWELRSDPSQVFDLSVVGSLDPGEQASIFSGSNAPATDAAAGEYRWALSFKFRNDDSTDFAQIVNDASSLVDQLNCGDEPILPPPEPITPSPTATTTTAPPALSPTPTPTLGTNHAPLPNCGADQILASGQTLTVACPFADPDTGDVHTCEISWGDGAVTTGTVNQSSTMCNGAHTYPGFAGPGPRSVSVCVTDDQGATGCDSVGLRLSHPSDCVLGPGAPGGVTDTDCDGLSDLLERYISALFPGICLSDADPDSDDDRLIDGVEAFFFRTGACADDSDLDGLLDGEEISMVLAQSPCLSPLVADGDGDGLGDGGELTLGADPCDPDSDNDGLGDGAEAWLAALLGAGCPSPIDDDSDDDGKLDGAELAAGTHFCDPGSPGQVLQVHHINVGQGDAALIISPGGEVAMVDDGRSASCSDVASYLGDLGITSIDYHFASHYHADHIACLDDMAAARITVATACYDRGSSYDSDTFRAYVATCGDKRQTVSQGQVITLDEEAAYPVTITVVDLDGAGLGLSADEENGRSLVLRLSYGAFDEVLAGDLTGGRLSSPDVESRVAEAVGDVEVYKVNHHGSGTSSNDTWLEATAPEVGIISVGCHSTYRHPTGEALSRLHEHGVMTYWTTEGCGVSPDPTWDRVGGNIIIEAFPGVGDEYTVSGAGISDAYVNQ